MKVKTNLSVYFEVFDTANENEYITDFPTLEEAISYVDETNSAGKHYAVDMVVDLEDTKTEETIIESGDRLYTMQVYPKPAQYNNHDMSPVLVVEPTKDDEEVVSPKGENDYDILRNKEKDVYYVWDNINDEVLADDDGDTIYFHTYDGASDYLADTYGYRMPNDIFYGCLQVAQKKWTNAEIQDSIETLSGGNTNLVEDALFGLATKLQVSYPNLKERAEELGYKIIG